MNTILINKLRQVIRRFHSSSFEQYTGSIVLNIYQKIVQQYTKSQQKQLVRSPENRGLRSFPRGLSKLYLEKEGRARRPSQKQQQRNLVCMCMRCVVYTLVGGPQHQTLVYSDDVTVFTSFQASHNTGLSQNGRESGCLK